MPQVIKPPCTYTCTLFPHIDTKALLYGTFGGGGGTSGKSGFNRDALAVGNIPVEETEYTTSSSGSAKMGYSSFVAMAVIKPFMETA